MTFKCFLSLNFFVITFFLQAQKIKVVESPNNIAGWERIISQQKYWDNDSTLLKTYLQPLQESRLENYEVLYNVMLANAYANSSDQINNKSTYYYKKAIQKAEKLKEPALEIWSKLSYADHLFNFRQMTAAFPFYVSAIEGINQSGSGDILFPGVSFMKIGFYMGALGDNREAINYLKKAQKFTKPRSSDYACILNHLGSYYLRSGDLENAKENIIEASVLSKSLGDEVQYAETLGNLAQVYEKKHHYEEAIKLVLEDIKISERKGADQNTISAYTILVSLYLSLNRYDEAKEAVNKASMIVKTNPYFTINELEILKLKLRIIANEGHDAEELLVRRRIAFLEDSLDKTDGVLTMNQANWMLHQRKDQLNLASTKDKLAEETLSKYRLFYITFVFFLIILIVIKIWKNREERKNNATELKIVEYENSKVKIEEELLTAHKNLDSQLYFLKEKNNQIQKLHREIENIKESTVSSEKDHSRLDEILQSHLMTEENWMNFKREFKKENVEFYKTLTENFPEITDASLRIILLRKLGFTNSETAGLLGITVDAIKKSKQRLKHKLGDRFEILYDMTLPDEK